MGNTNLPQFGAIDEKNSLDTRSGIEQLSDEQKKHMLDRTVIEVVPPDPAISPREAIIGHVNTGHSSPDAT